MPLSNLKYKLYHNVSSFNKIFEIILIVIKMIFLSVASKKSSSSGQSGGAMVANKDEAQGNVTTNAKGRCFNNILINEFI